MHWSLYLKPTRSVAQRQAMTLFDIVSGFVYSQTLRCAIDVGLLRAVKEPTDMAGIASQTNLTELQVDRLLRATNVLNLTKPLAGGYFGLGSLGMAVLSNPGLVELIKHHDAFYADMNNPSAVLKMANDSQLSQYWPYSSENEQITREPANAESVMPYSDLMSASQPMISEQVLQAYAFGKHKHVLDLGGGSGQFMRMVRSHYPDLELSIFDLPSVNQITDIDDLAQQRITFHSGNFFQTAFPVGADLVTLIRIVHDHNDEAVRTIFNKAHALLPHNGTLLIAEPLANTSGAERMGNVYFNWYFLAMGKGEPRSFQRMSQLLSESGFCAVKKHATTLPLVCSVISARVEKPQ